MCQTVTATAPLTQTHLTLHRVSDGAMPSVNHALRCAFCMPYDACLSSPLQYTTG